MLYERPGIRIVGVDGRIGPLIFAALDSLQASGALAPGTAARVGLGYETADVGLGWFYSHHHHFHVSQRIFDDAP